MIKLTMKEIINAIQGTIYIDGNKYDYQSISTDTRKLKENSIFIALKGDNFNGNDYVLQAILKGATICIVDEIKFNKEEIKEGITIIKVSNSKKALLDLAKCYRKKLDIKVVGITGSTGKTSTKDILAAFLSQKYKVFKTKGNFNNEIGLPLMIFDMDESYDIAVLEMGMSNFHEIHNLSEVAKPDIALITNIGITHIENLKTRENILKAKMEITDFFQKNNVLIVNSDNDLLKDLKSDNFSLIKAGILENSCDYKAFNIELSEEGCKFDIKNKTRIYKNIFMPIPGIHNVNNAVLAYACADILGVCHEDILKGIEKLERTSMRLDIIKNDNITLIDDTYNASPDSMKAAISVQKSLKGHRKIAILGTMKELGEESHNAHKDVGKYAKENGVDILIAVGEYVEDYKNGFNKDENFISFADIKTACAVLKDYIHRGDVVLVKASRSMKFEFIINELKKLND